MEDRRWATGVRSSSPVAQQGVPVGRAPQGWCRSRQDRRGQERPRAGELGVNEWFGDTIWPDTSGLSQNDQGTCSEELRCPKSSSSMLSRVITDGRPAPKGTSRRPWNVTQQNGQVSMILPNKSTPALCNGGFHHPALYLPIPSVTIRIKIPVSKIDEMHCSNVILYVDKWGGIGGPLFCRNPWQAIYTHYDVV